MTRTDDRPHTPLTPPLPALWESLRGPFPFATAAVFAATATATTSHYLAPVVLDVLMRRPDALAAGEWWRLVTPLFVHDKGWSQIVINLTGVALVGTPVERRLGGRRWLAQYFIPGVIGQAVAHVWYPEGAGASTGLSGISGAVILWLLRDDGDDADEGAPLARAAAFYGVFLLTSLVGRYAANLGMIGGDIGGAIAACTLLGVAYTQFRRRFPAARATSRFLGWAGTLGAVALTAMRDIHGPAVLAGMALAASFALAERRRDGRRGLIPRPETPR